MSKTRRLGKGIDALLQGRDITQLEGGELASVVTVPLDRVHPNPDQPRRIFNDEALQELARSIEERGIIQPILAEQQDDGDYLIVAGERRWRAAALAGLTVIPVLPGVLSEQEQLELALVENIQRQDLTPLEEARGYRDLIERAGISQEELARRLGKSRPAVANSLRLLKLPEVVQNRVETGELTAGHGRTLLGLGERAGSDAAEVAAVVARDGLSVREVERLVQRLNEGISLSQALSAAGGGAGGGDSGGGVTAGSDGRREGKSGPSENGNPGSGGKSVELRRLEEQLIRVLGTRVTINGSDNRGRIEVTYLSMDDLERLAELILGGPVEE